MKECGLLIRGYTVRTTMERYQTGDEVVSAEKIDCEPKRRTGSNELFKVIRLAGATPLPAISEVRAPAESTTAEVRSTARGNAIPYPQVFTGPALQMISFPLGGLGAGSIDLGGCGQLRDWEIFSRAHVGNSPRTRSRASGFSKKEPHP